MTTTTNQQINALAFLMSELRPGWDPPGCVAALRSLADLPLPQLMFAVARYATDAKNETPAAITYLNNRAWEAEDPWRCEEHPTSPRRPDGMCGACHANHAGTTEPQPLRRRGVAPTDDQRQQILASIPGGHP